MAGTFLCPNTCGFAKVVALEVSRKVAESLRREEGESKTKHHIRLQHEQYDQFKSFFSIVKESFNIDFTKFIKKLPPLRDAIKKWNFRKANEKEKFLETYSCVNWEKLSENRKKEHTFTNCKACALRHADVQALFPVKSNVLKAKALQNPVFTANNESSKLRSSNGRVVKPSKKDIKNTAKAIYEKVAPVFEKRFNMSFAEALTTIPDLNLQHESKSDKRKNRRHYYRQSKENTENQMAETAFSR